MQVILTPKHALQVRSDRVSLLDVCPVLDGVAQEGAHVEVITQGSDRTELQFTAPAFGAGAFHIVVNRENDSRVWLRYWITDLQDAPASFGIRFARVENLRAYLRNGYTSWDGSFYVEPEAMRDWDAAAARPETGFAMTQLLPRHRGGSVVVGFDRHDRFQQTFTFDTKRAPPSLTIQTLWDRKNAGALESSSLESERLVILEHAAVEDALREWACAVAAASPTPPRPSAPIIGWCSWYNLYGYIDEANILAHLRGAATTVRREHLPMRVFQIDDGFTPEMGDWLDVKPQFPRGMKPLLDDIRAAGFVPGLWIAPFMVGNRSRLYREHPDWVVRDPAANAPLLQWRFYGEFRWHKRSEEYYILDTTHPDAFEYLRRVFHVWRHEWGCEYFKTDFMYWGAEHGPNHARRKREGLTRIEIWRRAAEMIREEIGEATWLGCGCPLWASVGLVDGARIGSDVGVEWRGHLSAESLLRDQATRNFGNHILWQTDPDCILLRDRFHHLSDAEVRSLALYAGMSGGVTMTSDALDELSPDRLRLWKLLLNPDRATCRFPFLGQSSISYERLPTDLHSPGVRYQTATDPVLVQVRTSLPASADHTVAGVAALFIFNTGAAAIQRTYSLDSLGLANARYGYDWPNRQSFQFSETREVSVALASHDSTLLFVSPSPLDAEPERLP